MSIQKRMIRLLGEAENASAPALSVLRSELKAIAEIPDAKGRKNDPGFKLSLVKKEPDEPDDFDRYNLTVRFANKAQGEALKAWMDKHGWAIFDYDLVGGRWNTSSLFYLWPKQHVQKPEKYLHLL